jgi:hypothetical protein
VKSNAKILSRSAGRIVLKRAAQEANPVRKLFGIFIALLADAASKRKAAAETSMDGAKALE